MGRLGWEDRVVRMHPAAAVLSVLASGYLLMSIVFVGVGLVITHQLGFVTRWDDRVVRGFADHRTTSLNHWAGDATNVADTVGILVVLLLATIVLLLLRYRWEALFLIVTLALELSTFLTVNSFVHRPRPAGPRLGSLPSTSSFPSGHTAAMIALYGGFALLLSARFRGWLVVLFSWMIAVAAAAVVGVARVYSAMHHPSDVIAGAVLGFAVLAVAAAAVRVGRRSVVERQRARRYGVEGSRVAMTLDPTVGS